MCRNFGAVGEPSRMKMGSGFSPLPARIPLYPMICGVKRIQLESTKKLRDDL